MSFYSHSLEMQANLPVRSPRASPLLLSRFYCSRLWRSLTFLGITSQFFIFDYYFALEIVGRWQWYAGLELRVDRE